MKNKHIPESFKCSFELLQIAFENFQIKNIFFDIESKEYDGCLFSVNNKIIVFRKAKKTPTKDGFFVTTWKRDVSTGKTRPFDDSEPFDFFIIAVFENENKQGLFIFPKHALKTYDIISSNFEGGKRGFRVYPAWVNVTSRQARDTQMWQNQFFVN